MNTWISTTLGLPFVIVPVLSSNTTPTCPASSKAALLLIKIPLLAPKPVPTIMAVGVAKPNAHGQAMTNTEIITVTTNSKDSPPINPQ